MSLACAASAAAGERYAVVVGDNHGAGDEVSLRYAESDADKIAATLIRTGEFAPADVVTLKGVDAGTVRSAIIAQNDRIRRESAGHGVLFVYFSGHADAEALHLDGSALPLSETEELVRGSAAAFRVLVVDACRSGNLTHVKGGHSIAPFALPSSTPTSEGFVVLTAAAAGEDAQESDALQGSFFTHHLVSGLLGAADQNGDDAVTLDEAYGYAFARTVRDSSSTLAGTQHPTFRYDLRGKGDVVLSRLAGSATLTLPSGAGFLVFLADAVVAEIPLDAARRTIALAPGRYFVRGRASDAVYEGSVDVTKGAHATVQLDELERVDYARLVRKGDAEHNLAVTPEIAYAGHTPWLAGGSVCNGGALAVPVVLRYLTITPHAGLCAGGWQNAVLRAVETEGSLAVDVAHSFDLPLVSLEVGATAGALMLRQDFASSRIAPARTSGGPSLGVVAGATLPLPLGLHVGAGVTATSALLPIGANGKATTSTPAILGWRASFGSTF
ncbi:MAG TPA: caspase family protein [Myxococcota bacterium]|jgi:hypothetical protein